MNNRSHSQKKNFILIVSVFLGLVVFLSFLVISKNEANKAPAVFSMDLPTDKEDSKKLWAEELEEENKKLEGRLSGLEKSISSYQEKNQQNQEKLIDEIKKSKEKESSFEEERKVLEKEIAILKENLEASLIESQKQNSSLKYNTPQQNKDANSLDNEADLFALIQEKDEMVSLPLCEWKMDEKEEDNKVLNVDEVIPAGTTVKALLVSTLDAPCGVNANSDPQPIKLRILDNAHLPKKVQAKLKGCLIIGSAYGNISSERVWMRTERITKLFPGGSFIETEMSGYVTGEDGRYGVRGIVVDKTGRLLWRAGVAGFFSGLNQYLQATVNAQDIAKATQGLPNDVKWDVLKNSSLQGASSSLDKLTEYYIKRAEQLLPVIQVSAGRVVDVTFTHNVRLGDMDIKNKLKVLRDRSRIDVESNLCSIDCSSDN